MSSNSMTEPPPLHVDFMPSLSYLPTPSHATEGSAGLDLRAGIKGSKTIKPGECVHISAGLSIGIPPGYFGLIASRSGLSQEGIHLANGIGVIDSDYRGDVIIVIRNSGSEPFEITSGMRIAQLILVPYAKVQLVDVCDLADTERGSGGFGSTGVD